MLLVYFDIVQFFFFAVSYTRCTDWSLHVCVLHCGLMCVCSESDAATSGGWCRWCGRSDVGSRAAQCDAGGQRRTQTGEWRPGGAVR